jgi:RNA polymerase sigma factor (sigma-70 family)
VTWLRDPDWRERFLRGDKDVIEDIYRTTFEEVRRAAGSVLREPADRDAVVHEVFLELISSRDLRESYRGGQMGSWLGAIARHQSLDFARRESRLTDLSAIDEATDRGDPLQDLRRELARFAADLDPERQRLIQLRYIEGMTQMEAAAVLGKPRSTLEDWEHQFKRALRAHLAGKRTTANDNGKHGKKDPQ